MICWEINGFPLKIIRHINTYMFKSRVRHSFEFRMFKIQRPIKLRHPVFHKPPSSHCCCRCWHNRFSHSCRVTHSQRGGKFYRLSTANSNIVIDGYSLRVMGRTSNRLSHVGRLYQATPRAKFRQLRFPSFLVDLLSSLKQNQQTYYCEYCPT